MKEFITGLGQTMQARLEAARPDEDNILGNLKEKVSIVAQTITDLKAFVLSNAFQDQAEEIDFFKRFWPSFYAELLYYKRLLDLEINYPLSRDQRKAYLEKELARVNHFLQRKLYWVTYHRTGEQYLDERMFVRAAATTDPAFTDHALTADTRFSTTGSLIFSRIMCAEKLTRHLEEQLALLVNPYSQIQKSKPAFGLRWTGAQVDLIELMYALYAAGVLNEGKLHINQIAAWLQQTLKVDLGNYYRLFQGIRIRKKSRSKFLDELKVKAIEFMDNQDINPRYQ